MTEIYLFKKKLLSLLFSFHQGDLWVIARVQVKKEKKKEHKRNDLKDQQLLKAF